MATLRIRDFSTLCTLTLPSWATLTEAQGVMHRFHVHHVPVLRDGDIVGLVTAFTLRNALSAGDAHPERTTLEAIMEPALLVRPDMPVALVAHRMAEEQRSAVMFAEGPDIGLFTTVDAFRALERLTQQAAFAALQIEAGVTRVGRSLRARARGFTSAPPSH